MDEPLVSAAVIAPFAWLLIEGLRWLGRAHRRGCRRLQLARSVRRHPAGAWRQRSHVRIIG